MDNNTFGAAVPGTTPTPPQPTPNPTPEPDVLTPAQPTVEPVTEPAAPVATPADPGAPTVPVATPAAEPATTPVTATEPALVPTAEPAPTTEPTPVTEAGPTTSADTPIQPMGQPTEEELASNPFERPGADPFSQPTAAFPAELADNKTEAEAAPVTEAQPTTEAIANPAAPVTTPADPGAPTVPTTVGDNHVPEAQSKKKQTLIIIIAVAAVAIIALIIVLVVFVFGSKTLSCEGTESFMGLSAKEEAVVNFRFGEVDSVKFKMIMSFPTTISDSQIKTLEESANKNTEYDHVTVEKTGDKEVAISMSAKRDYFKQSGESYDKVKDYLTNDLKLTCK